MREIVFDIETTGLKIDDGDRIIEIGCIEVINRKTTGNNFHYFLNPCRQVSGETVEITGITDSMLVGKPEFKDIAEDLLKFFGEDQIIAHNSNFDVGFINAELNKIDKQSLKNKVVDTLYLARIKFPGKKNNLNALCERYNIDNQKRDKHGALLDAELLVEVYLKLTEDATLNFFGDNNEIKTFDIDKLKEKIKENETIKRDFPINEEELKLHIDFIEKYVRKKI